MKEYEIVYHIANLCVVSNNWKKKINLVRIDD